MQSFIWIYISKYIKIKCLIHRHVCLFSRYISEINNKRTSYDCFTYHRKYLDMFYTLQIEVAYICRNYLGNDTY